MFTNFREHDQSCTRNPSYVKRTKTGKLHRMAKTETLPTAIGRHARSLRLEAGLTLDDVAKRARLHGLKWAASRVGEFENGKLPITLATVLVVCASIAEATEVRTGTYGEIKLVDLLPDRGLIEVTPRLTVEVQSLRDALKGHGVELFDAITLATRQKSFAADLADMAQFGQEVSDDMSAERINAVLAGHGLTEHRAASSLGISELQLANAEAVLWGQSLSQERAARGGNDASAQKLGQITRALKAEVSEFRNKGEWQRGKD